MFFLARCGSIVGLEGSNRQRNVLGELHCVGMFSLLVALEETDFLQKFLQADCPTVSSWFPHRFFFRAHQK